MAAGSARCLSLAVAPLLIGAAPPPSLAIGPGEIVTGMVDGRAARFAVAPDGLSYPILNPAFADQIGLRGGLFGIEARIGSSRLRGRASVAKLAVASAGQKRRVLWFERAVTARADGLVGPDAVQQPVVTFQLRPLRSGDRSFILPLVRRQSRAGSVMKVGRDVIFVQWSLDRPASIATAAAAQSLALTHGGKLEGESRPETITFGIQRPVRTLTLATPVAIGPLRLTKLAARIADQGSVAGVADAGTDPDEILVVAAKAKEKPNPVLIIGTDAMAGCASITFDKTLKRIILACGG